MKNLYIKAKLEENNCYWNDLMQQLFDCPGLSRGIYTKTWLTPEEEKLITDIDACNAEYAKLKSEAE